jgi:hypothetical protein
VEKVTEKVTTVGLANDRIVITRGDTDVITISFAEVAIAAELVRDHLLSLIEEVPTPDELARFAAMARGKFGR